MGYGDNCNAPVWQAEQGLHRNRRWSRQGTRAFYLANHLGHVHATDLYNVKAWESFAPADFPENPEKYAPFQYVKRALAVSRMDAMKLNFPSDSFDVAFSFSSIEHFGGENHAGALQSVREMARVLKPGGIAAVATEYIINGKEALDLSNQFYNERTIYSDLIDKVDAIQLMDPLDLRPSPRTLNTVMDVRDAEKWDRSEFGLSTKRRIRTSFSKAGICYLPR